MDNIDDFFPSTFLKAADLNGRTKTLTIDKVVAEDVGGNNDPKDTKPVLHFLGDEKPIVLNKTNAGTISAVLGKNPTAWHGKKIEAFPPNDAVSRPNGALHPGKNTGIR